MIARGFLVVLVPPHFLALLGHLRATGRAARLAVRSRGRYTNGLLLLLLLLLLLVTTSTMAATVTATSG
uniref:Uncharacterized protein n=1 Tax=Anopheles braziliensis TaxID=58242 RepID=A0A2M3ZM44_9DIPT